MQEKILRKNVLSSSEIKWLGLIVTLLYNKSNDYSTLNYSP